MAKFVLKDAVVTVAGNDLSDHVSSVTVETTTDEVDVTGFTSSSFREFTDGFKDASITATFLQDFATGEVDGALWNLGPGNTAGTTFSVSVKATSAATSATNPIFTIPTAKMYGYNPIAGGVGDAASTDVTFRVAGTAGLTRGTS
jgi:hypothetical protein